MSPAFIADGNAPERRLTDLR
jgi:hypothetical protein